MRVVLGDYLQYCHDEIFLWARPREPSEELTVIVSIDFLFLSSAYVSFALDFLFHSTVNLLYYKY